MEKTTITSDAERVFQPSTESKFLYLDGYAPLDPASQRLIFRTGEAP